MNPRYEKRFRLLEPVAISAASGKSSGASSGGMRGYLAAMLVYRNEVLGIGYNKFKTHPFQKRYAKHSKALYLHAEIDCIINARKLHSDEEISRATMFVLRMKHPDDDHKRFIRAMAKPCCGCQRALVAFGIRKIVYTTEQGYDVL